MADNITILDSTGATRTMRTQDRGGVHFSIIHLEAAGTSTPANVSASASSVTLRAAEPNRRGLVIFNDSTNVLYVKYGTTASTTSFTHRLQEGESLVMGWTELYTGIVTGIWDGTNGAARVTELTP